NARCAGCHWRLVRQCSSSLDFFLPAPRVFQTRATQLFPSPIEDGGGREGAPSSTSLRCHWRLVRQCSSSLDFFLPAPRIFQTRATQPTSSLRAPLAACPPVHRCVLISHLSPGERSTSERSERVG